MDEAKKWQRRYEREKIARAEAERLLEEKSLALYLKTQDLDRLVEQQRGTIDERTRELRAALKEAKMLSDAISHTENGVILTGPDNKVIWANEAIRKITGYDPSSLVGKTPGHILQGPDSSDDTRRYMRDQIRERKPFEAEIINYNTLGEPYWIQLNATPVFHDGVFQYYVAIQLDITATREANIRLEKEIERANRMAVRAQEASAAKTQFLAMMSHELRTPLNGIIGYAQILEQNTKLGEKAVEQIKIMRRSGEHLLSLINDLLDISKIEAGSHHLVPIRFDLSTTILGVLEIIEAKALKKGLKLNHLMVTEPHFPAGKAIELYDDQRAIRQILINLLGNSIKFTDKGAISLDVEILDYDGEMGHIRFSVMDTGRGIPEDKRAQLFEAFKQVDEVEDASKGTGLGLYIAKSLVGMMGDTIHVESTVGRGSCFSFTIHCPMRVLDVAQSDQADVYVGENSRFPDGYAGAERHLLIVDDIAENRHFLTDLLGPIGFKLDTAENGREALKRIRETSYDLVLCDMIMPMMNGYELTKILRADPDLMDTCVIAVSASLMQLSNSERGEIKAFDGFVSKPVQAPELLEVIREKLNLSWYYPQESRVGHTQLGDAVGAAEVGLCDLQSMYTLAMKGDVKALRPQVSSLQQQDAELFEAIAPLLDRFKLQQLAALLEVRLKTDVDE